MSALPSASSLRSRARLRAVAWLALPLLFALVLALAPRAHGATHDGGPSERGFVAALEVAR